MKVLAITFPVVSAHSQFTGEDLRVSMLRGSDESRTSASEPLNPPPPNISFIQIPLNNF